MARGIVLAAIAVIGLALFLYWFNDSKIPETIPEQFKVKVIDANLRLFGTVASLGLSIDAIKSLGNYWLLLQSTGSPWWTYSGSALKVTSRTFSGVDVKMYEPTLTLDDPKRPVFIYLHGGAFTWLSAEVYEPFTSRIAEEAHIVVVSVNYRLVPEVTFPEPRSDCAAVLKYLLENGANMGLDPSRIAVGGDSAGGNLAASLALEFKDKLRAQLLLVPALQALNTWTSSAVENKPYMEYSIHTRKTFIVYLTYAGLSVDLLPYLLNNSHVSPEVKAAMYAHKLNHNKLVPPSIVRTPELRKREHDTSFGDVRVWNQVKDVFLNPYFSPLLAEDEVLAKLPPCYVMTAGHDIIRDDGVMFYSRLKALGKQVVLKNYEPAFHNSLLFHSGPLKLEVGEKILKDIVEYLKRNV